MKRVWNVIKQASGELCKFSRTTVTKVYI